jgi:hypothetical protein
MHLPIKVRKYKMKVKKKTNFMGRILDSIYVRRAANQSHLQTETANVQDRL